MDCYEKNTPMIWGVPPNQPPHGFYQGVPPKLPLRAGSHGTTASLSARIRVVFCHEKRLRWYDEDVYHWLGQSEWTSGALPNNRNQWRYTSWARTCYLLTIFVEHIFSFDSPKLDYKPPILQIEQTTEWKKLNMAAPQSFLLEIMIRWWHNQTKHQLGSRNFAAPLCGRTQLHWLLGIVFHQNFGETQFLKGNGEAVPRQWCTPSNEWFPNEQIPCTLMRFLWFRVSG